MIKSKNPSHTQHSSSGGMAESPRRRAPRDKMKTYFGV